MASDRRPDAHATRPGTAVQTSPSNPDRSPAKCVWCAADLGPSARRLGGRVQCVGCGAATTDPWPDAMDLQRAYAHYRPESGRFSGVGDSVLRWTRARLARRVDRVAPPGP